MTGEVILFIVALAYSAAVIAAGRHLQRPASAAAYSTAVAVLIAVPLLPDRSAQLVDHVVSVVGTGRLLVHLSFMAMLCGFFLTVALGTNRWSWRQQLAIGGSAGLVILFVLLWLGTQTLHRPNMSALYYGSRAGRPTLVLWMNVVMGTGIVYIATWSVIEFQHFLRGAWRRYEQALALAGVVLYALAGVSGALTIVEAVARNQGLNMALVEHVKTPLTAMVLAVSAGSLVVQIWLWPLWLHRRQLLLRYVEPELVQLRNDLLNLSATEAERRLDMHNEAYANRAIVEDVVAHCRAVGISPARVAMARMATSLITFDRDNVIQDPGYGLITCWDELREEAATEIDRHMAATAWEQARRDGYVSQQVYIIMFLVLDDAEYRDMLLIDERPRIDAWHWALAEIIATVMHEHGQLTPLFARLTRGAAIPGVRGRRRRSEPRTTTSFCDLTTPSTGGVGRQGYSKPTK